ncbi:lysylphosphatidylglycerol synthase transmembrane domain-containing protein [Olivibacter sp. CPCC 100613]|uniref:lysylphosphatidylglycerol synthase transmembrane domain-containing protein n=1 Tax=Olivibacter sp. CPCC 100613 TaxID=3079931 RepID=UPI002FFA4DE1
MLRFVKIVLFLSVAITLGFYIAHTDLTQVAQSITQIGWNFCWILLLTCCAYLLGTIAWAYCLGNQSKQISIYHLFWIRLIGETVSLFNPSSIIGGDFLKAELLKPYMIERKSAIRSVVVSRCLMISSQLILSVLALIILFMRDKSTSFDHPISSFFGYLIIIFSILGLIIFLFVRLIKSLRYKFTSFFSNRFHQFQSKLTTTLSETKQYYHQEKKALVLSFLFFSLHWFVGSLEFLLILYALDIHIDMIESLAMDMGVIFFKSAGALIPGQIGIEEYGNQFMLKFIGITGSIWLSVSVVRRVRQLIWLFLGGISYIMYYRKPLPLQAA